MRIPLVLAGILLSTLVLSIRADAPATGPALHVGFRRSEYGLAAKNVDDGWWIERAKAFAALFPNGQPTIVQIVSTYQDDDASTEFGFAKPKSFTGPTDHMTFKVDKLDHERALSAYDKAGVKAIIQFEPGDADLLQCLEVTHQALGQHPCIIGYGLDAEWYRTAHTPDKSGEAVSDAMAKAWMEKVVSLNKDYTFFIKHWEPKHLPPKYRHENLWFLSDSQDFPKLDDCMDDFKDWAKAFDGSITGYQFGYPKDRKWWSKLKNPPLELSNKIREQISSTRYLFWVDFTADKISFSHETGATTRPAKP